MPKKIISELNHFSSSKHLQQTLVTDNLLPLRDHSSLSLTYPFYTSFLMTLTRLLTPPHLHVTIIGLRITERYPAAPG